MTGPVTQQETQRETQRVTLDNFCRAETDTFFQRKVDAGMFGRLVSLRGPAPVDQQVVVRVNRDTLFTWGIFDLSQPIAVHLPDPGPRYQSMQVTNQDHHIKRIAYGADDCVLTQQAIGTRYVQIAVRTFVNPGDAQDLAAVHALQDAITVRQAAPGCFEVPAWDGESLAKVRKAVSALAPALPEQRRMFGDAHEVDPVHHLVGTATGFGGLPQRAVVYRSQSVAHNDGQTPYCLTVGDVPVDGFWSISVYNADGYFEPGSDAACSLNNVTARRDADGRVRVHFGGDPAQPNYLAIMPRWNYTVRLYQPHPQVLDGSWAFPAALPCGPGAA